MSHARKPWRNVRFWLLWPALFIFFSRTRRARVLVLCGDDVLLVKDRSAVWFADSRWSLPGGGIRKRETPEQGGARELREELGIDIDPTQLRLLSQEWISEYGLGYHGFFLAARLADRPKLVLEHREIATAEWLPIAKLEHRDLKHEARRALQLLAEQA